MRWLLALALAGCGDDLTLPSPAIEPYIRDLVPAGDSVYFPCDHDGARICARRGVEPIREVLTTEYASMMIAGATNRVALFTPTLDGGMVGEIDASDDEIRWFGEIVGDSYPRALWRAGDRTIVDTGPMWSIDRDGVVVELPFTLDNDSLIAEGDDATYVWADTLWRTDGTLAGTSELSGYDVVTAIVPHGAGALVVGRRAGRPAIWWQDDRVTSLLDLPDATPIQADVLCADEDDAVLVVGGHLVTTDYAGASRRESATFGSSGPGARLGGACYFFASNLVGNIGHAALWRLDPGEAPVEILAIDPPDELAVHGDRLHFAGYSDDGGIEPWISDGTSEGTHLAWDLALGPTGSYPRDYVVAGDHLHFLATVAALPVDRGYEDEGCALGGYCWSLCSIP